jgi:hypothetical protein
VAGGRGGGRIRFEVGGRMTIDGSVLATGADSQKADIYDTGTGAGAGGSIWIAVNDVVNGTGIISANGGSAADVNNMFYGSPGGGGRIALYYGGSVAPSLRVTAFGGTKGVAAQAGAGTVFLKNVLTSQSVLLIANSLENATSALTRISDTLLQAVVITDGARVGLETGSLRAGVVNITRNGFLVSITKMLLVQTEILTVVGGTISNARIVVCGRAITIGADSLVSAAGQGVDNPLLRGGAVDIGGGNIGVGGSCNPTAPKRSATTLIDLIANGDGGRGGGVDGVLGGGRVWLSAVESIELNGATVTASGSAGTATGAAGAGGFILLMSPLISANGSVGLRVRGGSAMDTTIGGGAGGGGAVHVLTNSVINETVLGINVNAGLPNTNLNGCTGAGAGVFVIGTLVNASVSNNSMPVFADAPTVSATGSVLCSTLVCRAGSVQQNGTRCEPCAAGNFSSAAGAVDGDCAPCAAGSFADTPGSAGCQPCAVGTFAAQTGSKVCGKCAAGSEAPRRGQQKCDDCQAGYFAGATGMPRCAQCAPGTATNATGATKCPPCAIGTHTDGAAGELQCKPCSKGSFANTTGTAKCAPCRLGTAINSDGSSQCDECAVGHTTLSAGATQCTVCAVGTFAGAKASPRCEPCAPGRRSTAEGQATCVECDAGTAQPLEGQSTCDDCGVNEFAARGAAKCSECAVGSFATGKADKCTTCVKTSDNVACQITTTTTTTSTPSTSIMSNVTVEGEVEPDASETTVIIVGSVVGAVLGIALIVGIAFGIHRFCKQSARAGDQRAAESEYGRISAIDDHYAKSATELASRNNDSSAYGELLPTEQ